MSATISCDLAIVGGGLAGGLIARAVHQRHPEAEIRLIEGGAHLGGNHLWSFFASDVAPAHRWLVSPLISHGWTRYDVAFPDHARTLKSPYYSIESRRFEREMLAALPVQTVMLERQAVEVSSTVVQLADGDRVEARGVIDCRGTGDLAALELGWQKFLGRELLLSAPHDLERPVVMDATVPQKDGYRFVYVLPFTPDTLLIEDTRYSDGPELDVPAFEACMRSGAGLRAVEASGVEEVVRAVRAQIGRGADWVKLYADYRWGPDEPARPTFSQEELRAAVEAARSLPFPFTLTARSENYLRGNPDLDDTIARLQAFEKAGADVLFAPGLPDLATVRSVCSAVGKPVNFMVGIKGKSFSVAELHAAGVRRISLATSLYRAAMTGLVEAAREVKEQGTFSYLDRSLSTAELNVFMQP